MRLIAVAFLAVLVSSATLRLPLPPPRQLSHNVGKHAKTVIDSIKLIQSQISNVRLRQQSHAQQELKNLIRQAEWRVDQLLVSHGKTDAVSTVHQAAQALHALADGATDVESGLQSALTEILMVMHQLGAVSSHQQLGETTPKSVIDVLLEEIQALVDTYLPIIGPVLGLTDEQIQGVVQNVDKFVADTEALEHGQVDVTDGLEAMITDILEILKALGIDWTAPTDETPTEFDALLKELEAALDALLDTLGPLLGLTDEQIQQIEADIDTLVLDIEAIEHGEIDVDGGLEKVLADLIQILHDFGVQSEKKVEVEATTPKSTLDVLLEEFQALIDLWLPLLGPLFGLTELEAIKITRQVDKFVADTEALEHGQVDVTDGLAAMITDILEILRILGIDWTAPTDETPTEFDALLAELEAALNAFLDTLGPLLGLTDEQVQIIEADIDQLIKDLEAVEHGEIDLDGGLEAIIMDLIKILHDFGVHSTRSLEVEATTPKSTPDVLLEEFQALIDLWLPLIGPLFGLTELEAIKITRQVDKFVADTEALEHGQVDVTDGLAAMITDILEILRILGIDWTAPTDETPTEFDALLAELEAALNAFLDILGPLLGLTAEQIKTIEGDIDALIKDFESIEHGEIDVDSGLELILQDLIKILHDFGVYSPNKLDVEATTPKSTLDVLLEEFQALIDLWLPLIGPLFGLTELEAIKITRQVDKFVADTEALEHGQVDVTDGLAAMINDILEILRILGIDWTAPTDETPTPFDGLLADLEAALDALLDTLGPLLGLTDEQVQIIEADIDQLIKDLEAVEHGEIDVDGGLEAIIMDLIKILHDFGVHSTRSPQVEATTPKSTLDVLLEEFQALIDLWLPLLGPLFGLTELEAIKITRQVDKFVADTEALEHGQVDVTDGLAAMITDILEILRILGIDWTAPTDETPTPFDGLLADLEAALDALLDTLGPLLGLTDEQVQIIEADIDQLIKDLEAVEHGEIDLDGGLEAIIMDLIKILHDFGVHSTRSLDVEATTPKSVIDVLLEEIQALVDTYLPIIGPVLGLTDEQIQGVVQNVDKFVADTEALEHGQVDVTDGLEAMITDIIEILKALGIDWTAPTDETPTEFDALLKELEAALDALLDTLGPLLGLTDEQIQQIEADIDTLILDIEAIEHGEIDVDGGLEKVLADIVKILHDFGVQSERKSEVEVTTPKSVIDVLLEEIQALVDTYLPIIGPVLGLTDEQIQGVVQNVDKFVADTEALEHGQVDVTDGLEAMITDIIEILKALGIDWTAPTDETPTEFDALLKELEAALDALLDTLGPLLGLTDEQIQQIEADIDTLILDIEAIEHGEIDVDGGLEKVLADIVKILHDFGVQSERKSEVEVTTPKSVIDVLLEEIQALVDTYLPIIGPVLGLTDEQIQGVVQNVDKFVADTEALEHGQVDVTDGLEAMITDIIEILKALGIDWTAPTDETPTEFDALLKELEAALDALLDTLGPLLGLTDEQIQQIEADIDTLILDIEAIEHGEIDVDGGLEKVLADIVKILHDFGVQSERKSEVEVTTPKSVIDVLLEEIQALVDTYLPIIGPVLGLTDEQIQGVVQNVDKFVADTEALEHGQVDVTDGLEAMITDIIEILKALGIDWTAPTDETPTEFDALLKELEAALDALLDTLGPLLGLTDEQIQQIEADIDTLILDIEAIEHGEIDVDGGLEKVLADIVKILHDFGVQSERKSEVEVTTPKSVIDVLLEEIQALVDTYLPIIGPVLGLTDEQIQGVVQNVDKFVADTEALEHGQVDVTDGLEAMITDIIEILKALGIDWTAPTDETPTEFDALLKELEAALDALLDTLGPLLGLTDEQIQQIEADIDTLILDIEAIEHGETDVDGGLEKVLADIVKILHDFGVQSERKSEVEATTIPTIIDMLLDELQHIVDTYLPIIAIATDLTWAQSQAIIENFDKFVADVKGMEHGTIEIATGVIDICIDILRVLEAFGVDVTLPSTDVPTTLDEVLFWLENGLNAVLDIVGPFIGLDYDATKQVEADIHTLINDIRDLGDGRIDVDRGLENILTDLLVILGDFGVPTSQRKGGLTTDTPSTLDQLLEELQAIVDQYLPVLGPLFGLTDEQIAGVVTNFDKFVADVEALEHGTVDVSTGVEDIVIDLIEILKALGIDDTLPTDDTPTDLDGLLAQLESMLNTLLNTLGPILGLTDAQVQQAEADIDTLIKDIEAIEHGHIDIDSGLEKIIVDIFNILKDFGLPVLSPEAAHLSLVARLAELRRPLTGLVASLPLAARATVRADLHHLGAVFHQLAVVVPVRA
ncbi:uncharacterized protein LOC122381461 isoform X6 [Amphibalanus amphitrite]|uniref:uncharacterized protein LOC122381461 isoform X6 n=1 Tax=Amphibalanus amphitrite TaxID=1232801 RepID=UPI001C921B53|nr:uncharacterized protein LOC122381461 isoform X6 [Amphibalanus amphitrite]